MPSRASQNVERCLKMWDGRGGDITAVQSHLKRDIWAPYISLQSKISYKDTPAKLLVSVLLGNVTT